MINTWTYAPNLAGRRGKQVGTVSLTNLQSY